MKTAIVVAGAFLILLGMCIGFVLITNLICTYDLPHDPPFKFQEGDVVMQKASPLKDVVDGAEHVSDGNVYHVTFATQNGFQGERMYECELEKAPHE